VTETQLVSKEYFWDKLHPIMVKEENRYTRKLMKIWNMPSIQRCPFALRKKPYLI